MRDMAGLTVVCNIHTGPQCLSVSGDYNSV